LHPTRFIAHRRAQSTDLADSETHIGITKETNCVENS
jgi:hypothetical protein